LKKKLLDIYYSLEGYLKYKYFKKYEVDEFNRDLLDDLEKYLNVKKRLVYSMFFWNTFNILALRYIMNCFYFNPLLRFAIYSIFITPNIWFYLRKFKSNRIDMQKLFIIDYLNKQKLMYNIDNKEFYFHSKNEDIDIGKINSENLQSLEMRNELEKYLDDYYNNAIYGKFFCLKIE